jgi:hypothetical protein
MRKLIYGALAMAAALSITAGVNTQEAAAASTPKPTTVPTTAPVELNVDVNLDEQSMTVTGKTQISVAFPTVKADKDNKTKLTVTVKNWDVYEGETATVDLSKLNPSKDSYVVVKDESDATPQLLVFQAETRKFNAVYTPAYTDSDKPTIKIQVAKTDLDEKDTTAFQYRTAYSSWNDLVLSGDSPTDLTPYLQEGAQLNIRAASALAAESEDASSAFTASGYDVVEAGTLPSKEFKVKIAALPNAPTVTADYKNNQFKLKKGAQYRTDYTGAWVNVPDSLVIKLSDLSDKTVLQSRLAADSSKKKAASKITSVTVTQPAAAPELIDTDNDATVLAEIQEAATSKDTEILKTDENSKQSITVKLDAKKGTIITNKTGVSIDVVQTKGTTEKVTSIKDTKSATIKYDKDTSLAVRYSAVTKDVVDKTTKDITQHAAWASVSAELGTMVQAYVAPSAAPSEAPAE